MDFLGFLRFSLFCFDFLAWPAFALGYPLWASIRAIETSSKSQMRKLVSYWTIFSFISLFEIFCSRFIEWIPFWPYIKLVIVCWLVIPEFEGACYVYQRLIHPCLSVNLQDIIYWFCILKEKPFSEEVFLALAEKYIKENGSEALEKLIAIKANCKEGIIANTDALELVKRVEPADNVTAGEQLVDQPKPHLVQSERIEIADAEAQKVTMPVDSKDIGSLEIRDPKEVRKEWTCAMCQVTTTSEGVFNNHLQGKKHRSRSEKLKTCTETASNTQSPDVKTSDSDQAKEDTLEIPLTTAVDHPKPHLVETKEETAAAEGQKMTIPVDTKDGGSLEMSSLKTIQKEWTCAMCQVTTTSEVVFNNHLQGKKHRSRSEKLKTCTEMASNTQSPDVKTSDSDQAKEDTLEIPLTTAVDHPKPHLVETKEETAAAEGQKMTIPVDTKDGGSLEMSALKTIQKEWTCAMCQVTTSSEALLNAHLQGKKHRSNCEKLKQTAKNIQSPAWKQKPNLEEPRTSKQTEMQKKAMNNNAAVFPQQFGTLVWYL